MRAKEFINIITESKITTSIEGHDVIGYVDGEPVGMATFEWDEERQGWYSEATDVDPEYQRLGVATAIYNAAKQKFGKIIPSIDQTVDAKKFWQGKQMWEAESLQLDEGLGDWIEQKMDDLLNPYNNHNYSNRPDAVASAVKAAPVNLPDDVAEQLVAEFLKRKEHEAALEQAARAQGTTVEKIRPYLNYFVGNFVDRWRRIPARDKQQFWKDLALSVFRLIMFILQAMAKGKR